MLGLFSQSDVVISALRENRSLAVLLGKLLKV